MTCGFFSKKDASKLIAAGNEHIHSSVLGKSDHGAQSTQAAVDKGVIPTYSWETHDQIQRVELRESKERHVAIDALFANKNISAKRETIERSRTVLEEILTNAIYHAPRRADGSEKYRRSESISLAKDETIYISIASEADGIFLSVTDLGGTLSFEHIRESMGRCYGESQKQIESKESGAGLGVYLVFETATHVKIVTDPGKSTTVSVWISSTKTFDQDTFSFNFFRRGPA